MITLIALKLPVNGIDTAAAYARQARRCTALVKWLDAALWEHGFAAAAEPENRGYVVELAVLEQRLTEALGPLAGPGCSGLDRQLAGLDEPVR
jgi:hypothetical protein